MLHLELERRLLLLLLLRSLRFLDVKYLGFDGSSSHKGTRSDPAMLLDVIKELPDLRWLATGNNRDSSEAFDDRARLMRPNLQVNTDELSRSQLAFKLCVT